MTFVESFEFIRQAFRDPCPDDSVIVVANQRGGVG